MDDEELIGHISLLDCKQPSDLIYRTLVTIRCKYSVNDKYINALVNHELVAKLIPLLQRPNSKIVDMSLSVLGNLLMHRRPREQAREHKGVELLVRIISTLAEEKILGRVCRVIANLSQDGVNSREFLNLGIIPLLLKTLKDVKSAKAKISVIRAIRILSQTHEGRVIALENKAVADITSYLSSNDSELLKSVCKSLSVLTGQTKSKDMAEQIGSETGGFKLLVDLSEHQRKSMWIPALMTLSNLSKHEHLRPLLGNVGAITAMTDRAMSEDLSSMEFATVVKALCHFSNESVNRIKLRESGALKLFVQLLASDVSRHKTVREQIIFCLPRFGYDALSLKVMGDEGIVSCLTNILDSYIEKHRYTHCCAVDDDADAAVPSDGATPSSSTRSTSSSDVDMLDLSSTTCDTCDSSVESENEILCKDVGKEMDNALSQKPKYSGNVDASDQNYLVIDFALQFLLRVFEIQLPSEELTKADNVKALVRYICWTKGPSYRAGLILNRIAKSMKYIKPFLLQGLFPWLRLEVSERLYGCKELTCLNCQNVHSVFTSIFQEFVFTAETGYIEGTVCHTLLRGSNEIRTVMTIGIVAIIMCHTLLFNILITHGGLDVLLEALETETGEMFSHAVLSFRLLAKRVNIESSIMLVEGEGDEAKDTRCCYEASATDKDFELVTDDGAKIGASRRVLAGANNVFGAMLDGQFSESSGKEIRLPGANSGSVRLLVHHLYGCKNCTVLNDTADIDAWLDLVPLTDKYLLTDFNREICRKIMHICMQNVGKIIHAYKKSLTIVCPTRGQEEALNISIVSFLLVGEVHHPVRVKLYDELAKNPELKSDFLEDVSSLITNHLKVELQKPRRQLFKSH